METSRLSSEPERSKHEIGPAGVCRKAWLVIVIFALLIGAGNRLYSQELARQSAGRSAVRISLEPNQRLGWIELLDSCLIPEKEITFSVSLPLSEPFTAALQAGSPLFIPEGRYEMYNPSVDRISYVLISEAECKQVDLLEAKEVASLRKPDELDEIPTFHFY